MKSAQAEVMHAGLQESAWPLPHLVRCGQRPAAGARLLEPQTRLDSAAGCGETDGQPRYSQLHGGASLRLKAPQNC